MVSIRTILMLFVGLLALVALVVVDLDPKAEFSSREDAELASEIEKLENVDLVKAAVMKIKHFSFGHINIESKNTFSMTDSEVQSIADSAADLLRAKYPQTSRITFSITGEKNGLRHTISFIGLITGVLERGEVTCTDPRCSSEVIFQSPFTA